MVFFHCIPSNGLAKTVMSSQNPFSVSHASLSSAGLRLIQMGSSLGDLYGLWPCQFKWTIMGAPYTCLSQSLIFYGLCQAVNDWLKAFINVRCYCSWGLPLLARFQWVGGLKLAPFQPAVVMDQLQGISPTSLFCKGPAEPFLCHLSFEFLAICLPNGSKSMVLERDAHFATRRLDG